MAMRSRGMAPRLTTTFDSATQVHATVPAADVTTAGTIQIAVKDASNNSTNALPFIVTGGTAGTPPTLTSLNPNTSFNNVPSLNLTANWHGFRQRSVIVWNGTAMPTTFVSSTQLTTTVPAAYLTLVGTANVFVLNPDSTVSNTLPFTITVNPATTPTLTSISPTKTAVGSPGFTLTLNGTNFAPGCVAYLRSDRTADDGGQRHSIDSAGSSVASDRCSRGTGDCAEHAIESIQSNSVPGRDEHLLR